MPAKPRWLLAIQDAIGQLEELERELLTRRDLERLFGVSRARAATLMRLFGAELTGYTLTLPRAELLRQLRLYRKRGVFRAEEQRRARLVTELRKARLTGIRVPVPAEALQGRLSGLPAGVLVEQDRIEVRFTSATEAVKQLYGAGSGAGERLRALRNAGRRGAVSESARQIRALFACRTPGIVAFRSLVAAGR